MTNSIISFASFTCNTEALRPEYISLMFRQLAPLVEHVTWGIILRLGQRSATLRIPRFIPLGLCEMQNGDVTEENPTTPSKVFYIYDTRMMQHECIPNFHPEQPLRISSIFAKLEEAGCIHRMTHVPCREALQEEITLVHTQELWHMVEDFKSASYFSSFRSL